MRTGVNKKWSVDDFTVIYGHHLAIFYPCEPMEWIVYDGETVDRATLCGCTAYEFFREKIETGSVQVIQSYSTENICLAYYCNQK